MPRTSAIRALPFSEAKARLSELMNEVVHRHRPQLVERHGGKETMALLPIDDLALLLQPFHFEVEMSVAKGETTAVLHRFDLIGTGKTAEEALDALLDVLRDYAQVFIERWDFYRHTDRAQLLPQVLRFALTPADRQRDLLLEAE